MSEPTSFTASVPALSLQRAAWGIKTATSGGAALDFSADLDDVDGSTYDVSGTAGSVAVEFDNSANDTLVAVNVGSNTADIPVPGGTSRTLVFSLSEAVTLTAATNTDVLVIAYVRPS